MNVGMLSGYLATGRFQLDPPSSGEGTRMHFLNENKNSNCQHAINLAVG